MAKLRDSELELAPLDLFTVAVRPLPGTGPVPKGKEPGRKSAGDDGDDDDSPLQWLGCCCCCTTDDDDDDDEESIAGLLPLVELSDGAEERSA